MKQIFPILFFAAMLFTACEQNVPLEQTTAEYIKGHTFALKNGVALSLTFHNKTVDYTWQNSLLIQTRSDLYYELNSIYSFTIYREKEDSVYGKIWGNGTYYPQIEPYILLDNLIGDTLYLK